MLDLNYLKDNKKEATEGLLARGVGVDIDKILDLDSQYKKVLQEVESLRAQRNQVSDTLSKDLDKNKREEHLREAENLKKSLKQQEEYLKDLKNRLDSQFNALPNIPFAEVPRGKDEKANVVLREEGKKPNFKFKAQDYLKLAKKHNLIDIERAAKVSGSRFGYLKNQAAVLEFALVRFAMDSLQKEGFMPLVPPVLIKRENMQAMGYLEKEPDDIYYLEKDDMHLVGTSEQSVVPMHKDEVLDKLPLRYGAFSTCFRREAGSYGKDTKGILRVHQFDKIEMVSFTHPDKSKKEHKMLLGLQEKLMQDLEIPYQVVAISTGDMGFPAAQQFDIESWIPSENKYRETHSTSNTTDFQARRLNIRYQAGQEKGFVHILNGTAFAIGRTLIALLENHQNEDGSIKIPKTLHKYTGFSKIE